MKIKTFFIALSSILVLSCSSDDDNDGKSEGIPILEEQFIVTIDKDTVKNLL